MSKRNIDTLTRWGKFWWILFALVTSILAGLGAATILFAII